MPLPVLRRDRQQRHVLQLRQALRRAPRLTPLNSDEAFSATSHLLIAMTSARPSSSTWSAILRSCDLEPAGGVEQQHDDFGEIDRAAGVGDRELLELVLDLGLLAHAGGVDQPDRPHLAVRVGPLPVDGDRIARDPGLGPGEQPVLAEHAVDQGRLAGVGPADDRELERRRAVVLFVVLGRVRLVALRSAAAAPRTGRPCLRHARR